MTCTELSTAGHAGTDQMLQRPRLPAVLADSSGFLLLLCFLCLWGLLPSCMQDSLAEQGHNLTLTWVCRNARQRFLDALLGVARLELFMPQVH